MLKLYSNIKKYRKQLNMSQQQLAEAVGYKGKSMIAQVENGRVNLPSSMITKFAEVFNCTENDLLGDDDTTDVVGISHATAVTEPGEILIPELPHYDISHEDQELLDLYHGVTPETKAAIDLLLKAGQQNP